LTLPETIEIHQPSSETMHLYIVVHPIMNQFGAISEMTEHGEGRENKQDGMRHNVGMAVFETLQATILSKISIQRAITVAKPDILSLFRAQ
jgi:hypothetical protein